MRPLTNRHLLLLGWVSDRGDKQIDAPLAKAERLLAEDLVDRELLIRECRPGWFKITAAGRISLTAWLERPAAWEPEIARQAGLTERQNRVLVFIRDYMSSNRIAPSYAEIKLAAGLKSLSGVSEAIDLLCERGYLTRLPRQARSLALTDFGRAA